MNEADAARLHTIAAAPLTNEPRNALPSAPGGAGQQGKAASRGAPGPRYANICRLTGTAEELILDFGLAAETHSITEALPTSQRLVLLYSTAKRLAASLEQAIQRHESLFGYVEVEVARRVVPGLNPPASTDW